MGNTFRFQQRLRVSVIVLVFLLVTAGGQDAAANPKLEELAQRLGVRVLAEATSDRDVLKSAKARIPYDKMSQRSQQRTKSILDDMSQYRRMPCLQYEVNPDMYQFLVNHPDVAISTWRVMGISELVMHQTGPFEFEATATDGSQGIADVLWRDGNQCLFIVEGSYQSPLLPGAIQASALVWLQYRFVPGQNGTVLVNQQVETFVQFPSTAVDTLARLASVVTNTILDRNVFEVSLYAKMMSTAAEKEPEWIAQVASRMENVAPQRRLELVQVARYRQPNSGRRQTPVRETVRAQSPNLTQSQEFQAFETSMRQVNRHVPLVVANVPHETADGPDGGSANPDSHSMPAVVSVPEKPRHRSPARPVLSELMTEVPELTFADTSDSQHDHVKATSANALPPASRPLTTTPSSGITPSVAPKRNTRPVSNSQPLTTDVIDLTLE